MVYIVAQTRRAIGVVKFLAKLDTPRPEWGMLSGVENECVGLAVGIIFGISRAFGICLCKSVVGVIWMHQVYLLIWPAK